MKNRPRRAPVLVLAILFLGGATCYAAAPEGAADDLTIVPGLKVGAIAADSTEDQLKGIYGAVNVQDALVDNGEGKRLAGAVIFPNDPRKEIEVIWKDGVQKQGVNQIWLRSSCSPLCQSDWALGNGLAIGSTLQDLQRLNGGAFTMANFKGRTGGWVQSWNNGLLDATLNSSGTVIVRLTGPGQGGSLTPGDQITLAQFDTLSSDSQILQNLNPTVSEMRLEFQSGGQPPQ